MLDGVLALLLLMTTFPHMSQYDPLQDELLRSLGFEAAPELAPDLSCYRIWRKKMLDSESSADRAAFNESSRSRADWTLRE